MFDDLERKLKCNGEICDMRNVPVGITVSTSSRFFVKFSLSNSPRAFDKLEDAINFIINYED